MINANYFNSSTLYWVLDHVDNVVTSSYFISIHLRSSWFIDVLWMSFVFLSFFFFFSLHLSPSKSTSLVFIYHKCQKSTIGANKPSGLIPSKYHSIGIFFPIFWPFLLGPLSLSWAHLGPLAPANCLRRVGCSYDRVSTYSCFPN